MIDKHYVPLVTAAWMIVLPLVLVFLAGAGAGTGLDGLAKVFGTFWSIYGGVSLICGTMLLLWVIWSAWRAGDLAKAAND